MEKAENATRLAVFGDSLAIDLSKALERLYAEDPNLVVINQGVSNSGFVRNDYFDWDEAIDEQIAANSFDLAVVMIGINDRQELNVDGQDLPSLTEGWNAAYQARIASFLRQAARGAQAGDLGRACRRCPRPNIRQRSARSAISSGWRAFRAGRNISISTSGFLAKTASIRRMDRT